ncbi:MAG: hypothetical protein RLZZ262_1794 [Bacteroidota bacterium]|jgi:uncharacterized protein
MILALFSIAFVYSSVGFGGGSLYLTILSQVYPGVSWIRFPALLCNASVTAIGSLNFARAKWLPFRPVLQLLAFSIPFTIWAASWKIATSSFLLILGAMLFVAGAALCLRYNEIEIGDKEIRNPWWLYPIVAVIGVLSGITGIGGGIYLAPFLHHSRWASTKAIAATTSFFILINSVFSILVLLWNGLQWNNSYFGWIAAVILGGWMGSKTSIRWMQGLHLRIVTALILMFVGIKIWLDHWNIL